MSLLTEGCTNPAYWSAFLDGMLAGQLVALFVVVVVAFWLPK